MLLVIVALLLVGTVGTHPVFAITSGYYYAGQTTGLTRFAGGWGYITTTDITLSQPTQDHTAHWVGKTDIDGLDQWTQTGWCAGICGNKQWGNTEHFYIEYKDYISGYDVLDYGLASGNNQFAVWSDGVLHTDTTRMVGYYNVYVNTRSLPSSTSPSRVVRLSHGNTRIDAIGEVYNSTTTAEPMGTVTFGNSAQGSAFFDIGSSSNGTVNWQGWASAVNTPSLYTDAPYTLSRINNYQKWTVSGP
jgi:hypothetical protein